LTALQASSIPILSKWTVTPLLCSHAHCLSFEARLL
jgi:hypothetical protein